MDDHWFSEWFSMLPLDNKVTIYKTLVDMDGSPINEDYENYLDQIYADFFGTLDKMVCAKYGPDFSVMKFKTWWHVYVWSNKDDRSLNRVGLYAISLVSDPVKDDMDEKLLAQLEIPLDENKLNATHIITVFNKIDECLENAFRYLSPEMKDYDITLILYGAIQKFFTGV